MKSWASESGHFLCAISRPMSPIGDMLGNTGHDTNCVRCKLFFKQHTVSLVANQFFSSEPLATVFLNLQHFSHVPTTSSSIGSGTNGTEGGQSLMNTGPSCANLAQPNGPNS